MLWCSVSPNSIQEPKICPYCTHFMHTTLVPTLRTCLIDHDVPFSCSSRLKHSALNTWISDVFRKIKTSMLLKGLFIKKCAYLIFFQHIYMYNFPFYRMAFYSSNQNAYDLRSTRRGRVESGSCQGLFHTSSTNSIHLDHVGIDLSVHTEFLRSTKSVFTVVCF